MIRCDIVKGKASNSPVEPAWQAQPRKSDSFVLDLGNIGNKSRYFSIWFLGI